MDQPRFICSGDREWVTRARRHFVRRLMRPVSSAVLGASIVTLGVLVVPSSAHAADEGGAVQPGLKETDTAAPSTNPWVDAGLAERRDGRPREASASARPAARPSSEEEHKQFALGINPLAILIGRYSIEGQYLPVRHHAFTVNPFYARANVTGTVNGQEVDLGTLSGFGGELGYRFYTGSKGANGFFVGPSFLLASYSQSAPSGAQTSGSDSFLSYGGAIDLGGQAIIGPGVVLGGGFGLQYTKTSIDIDTENLNLASAIIAGGGIRPRFLFLVGYAF